MSPNKRFGSPSSGSSVQTGPPQTVRSVYLEACRQDRVVTHNAKPPTWWGQRGEMVGGQTKHSSSHHSGEKGESERKTGVSATVGGGGTERVKWECCYVDRALTGRHIDVHKATWYTRKPATCQEVTFKEGIWRSAASSLPGPDQVRQSKANRNLCFQMSITGILICIIGYNFIMSWWQNFWKISSNVEQHQEVVSFKFCYFLLCVRSLQHVHFFQIQNSIISVQSIKPSNTTESHIMLRERGEKRPTYCHCQRQTPAPLYMVFYITMKTWNSVPLIDLQQKSKIWTTGILAVNWQWGSLQI